MTRCDNDLHFYDPNIHNSCPYCRDTDTGHRPDNTKPAMIRCDNDLHFYDPNKYNFCPYCEDDQIHSNRSNMIRCAAGLHFYNSSTHTSCPYCTVKNSRTVDSITKPFRAGEKIEQCNKCGTPYNKNTNLICPNCIEVSEKNTSSSLLTLLSNWLALVNYPFIWCCIIIILTFSSICYLFYLKNISGNQFAYIQGVSGFFFALIVFLLLKSEYRLKTYYQTKSEPSTGLFYANLSGHFIAEK